MGLFSKPTKTDPVGKKSFGVYPFIPETMYSIKGVTPCTMKHAAQYSARVGAVRSTILTETAKPLELKIVSRNGFRCDVRIPR